MREIKLRYKYQGEFYYIDLYNDNTAEKFKEYELRNKTTYFEQYTGLKDKNGVEIYEGDIVFRDYNHLGRIEVSFSNGVYNISGYKLSKCEVIGNIHENK